MEELKAGFVALLSGLIVMLNPIEDFIKGMLLVFTVNYLVGWIADVAKGKKWSMKKTFSFGLQCFVFFGIIAFLFVVGHFMHKHDEALIGVQYICLIALWAYSRNTLRNLKDNILKKGSTMYLIVDILLFIVSFEMLEKIPLVKKYFETEVDTSGTVKDET